MADFVKISMATVMRFQDRPEIWNELWRIGRMDGQNYVAPAADFDALCEAHFSPFAPGEVAKTVAAPLARALGALGVSFAGCGCAERRLAWNGL